MVGELVEKKDNFHFESLNFYQASAINFHIFRFTFFKLNITSGEPKPTAVFRQFKASTLIRRLFFCCCIDLFLCVRHFLKNNRIRLGGRGIGVENVAVLAFYATRCVVLLDRRV